MLSNHWAVKTVQFSTATVLLSFVLFVHQRELTPLFASVPTNKHLLPIAWAAAVIAAAQPARIPLVWNGLCATLAFLAAPRATYGIAVVNARTRDPVRGPAITHLLTLAPLTFLLASFAVQSVDSFDSLVSIALCWYRLDGRSWCLDFE